MPFQARSIHRIATGLDAPQQGRANLARGTKQPIQLAHRRSRLVLVRQGIIACFCVTQVIASLSLPSDPAPKPRREPRETVPPPGPPPWFKTPRTDPPPPLPHTPRP